MKRINDDPYWPELAERFDPNHKIPKLDARTARRMGFEAEGDQPLDYSSERKRIRRVANYVSRMLGTSPAPERSLRRRPGRQYQEPSDSFRAFLLVQGEKNRYRAKFEVKRVPATETDKFIAWAMRMFPNASEDRVREHLNKSQKLLPTAENSNT